MNFDFATAGRILFGPGTRRQIAAVAGGFGRRALVVTGADPTRAVELFALLAEQRIYAKPYPITGEPTLQAVRDGVAAFRSHHADVVIAIGGGSPIDGGKAIAAMATNSGEPLDYLEVIGKGQTISNPAAPMVAIPTTAGTGSEATRNAVLASPEHRVKASLRAASMLPRAAIVDPELTLSLPPETTAATGCDALTQLIEPFTSLRANPITDALCVEALTRAAQSLRVAFHHPGNLEARTNMSFASLCGGIALANASLGAVHGFAAPIGGMFAAPHGAVCAALLPYVTEANVAALRPQPARSETMARYTRLAQILTGNPAAAVDDAVKWLHALTDELRIPRLRTYGIAPQHIPDIVEKATQASSMKGNPVVLSRTQLAEIIERAL